MSDNIADGWRGVAGPLTERPGGTVLVLGGLAQSVGIYAAGAAVALGASRVLYLDDNADRCERAVAMGATAEPLALKEGRAPKEQFDVVVEAAGDAGALAFGVNSCAPNGVLTSVAIHLDQTSPIPANSLFRQSRRTDPAPLSMPFAPRRADSQLLSFFELRFAQSDARRNYLSQIFAKSLICNGLTLRTRGFARSQEVENRE
jgi:NADPH:quinone reductase-like Zn-dependent oxidoreductase